MRRKAKPDIYTVLLVIALCAVIVGIVFLCLYNADYEWKFQGAGMNAVRKSAFDGPQLAHRSNLPKVALDCREGAV
ncbi:MAG: hypothetical protein ABFC63_03620 [Thermoguttaceae bacterium]